MERQKLKVLQSDTERDNETEREKRDRESGWVGDLGNKTQ